MILKSTKINKVMRMNPIKRFNIKFLKVNISFSMQNVLLGFGEQRNDVLTIITVLIKQQLFICRSCYIYIGYLSLEKSLLI